MTLLSAYFNGHAITPPWHLLALDPFSSLQRAVWQATAEIGFGSLCTYKDLAAAIGRPRAFRFVGTALGRNPFPILIPCHRVVRSDGGLGGFSGGPAVKAHLIAWEKRRGASGSGSNPCATR